jgi:hypothetical protein
MAVKSPPNGGVSVASRVRAFLRRRWDVNYEQCPKTGEILKFRAPLLRRLFDNLPRALIRHWLAHWQFWMKWLLTAVIAAAAVATLWIQFGKHH